MNADTFRERFGKESGQAFSPRAFRSRRLELLQKADAMIVVYAGVSESSAFEVAYNIFAGNNAPILYLIWKETPVKTTLLQDLQDLGDVTYVSFGDPAELSEPLLAFLKRVEGTEFSSSAFASVPRGKPVSNG